MIGTSMEHANPSFLKTKYCGLWQRPKIAWLRRCKPEERVIDTYAMVKVWEKLLEASRPA